jgi:hypothetical protein
MTTDNTTANPPRIHPVAAIDLAVVLDADTNAEYVVMRVIDQIGARVDVPLPAPHAASFGRALVKFAEAV